MDFVTIFFFLASFNGLRLLLQDLRSRLIDERLSYYMMGVSGVIFLALDLLLFWIVLTVFVIFFLAYIKQKPFMRRQNLLGNGDISVFSWLLPSLFVLNFWFLIAFGLIYCTTLMIYRILSKKELLAGTIPIFIGILGVWLMHILNLLPRI